MISSSDRILNHILLSELTVEFVDDLGTAGVAQNSLVIDRNFWKILNSKEKEFLLDHELLHVYFKHVFEEDNDDNLFQDLAINSYLLSCGRYCKGDIPTLYKEGQFPDKLNLPDGKSHLWYKEAVPHFKIDLLQRLSSKRCKISAENLVEKLKNKQKTSGQKASEEFVSEWIVKEKKLCERIKFSTFVKDFCRGRTTVFSRYDLTESWIPARRSLQSGTLLFQSESLIEDDGITRKNIVLVFLDFSESCKVLWSDFVSTAKSIPKRFFQVKTFVFNTNVKEISLDNVPLAGGGTDFAILAAEAANHNYDSVFVITDGAGTNLDIPLERRKDWIWFLPRNSIINLIPRECRIEFLSLFEKEEKWDHSI